MGSEGSGNFGGKLRSARERKGVSLRQIATRTKISMAVLEALERNDIARLPGGIFSRAFVRSYAHEVGLDPETTIQEFLSQFPHDSVTAGHPRSHPVEDTEMFESDRRVASSLLWMLIISIPLAVAVLYFSVSDKFGREEPSGRPQGGKPVAAPPASTTSATSAPGTTRFASSSSTPPPAAGASSPIPARSATDAAASRAASDQGSRVAIQPAPTSGAGARRASGVSPAAGLPAGVSPAPTRATSGATPPPSPPSSVASTSSASSERPAPGTPSTAALSAPPSTPASVEKLTVVLSARGPVWVSATVDGQKVIGRLLQTGDQQTVEVKRELMLTAGDGAAMRMVVNGVEARALGKAGEVVTARVTLANFRDYLQPR